MTAEAQARPARRGARPRRATRGSAKPKPKRPAGGRAPTRCGAALDAAHAAAGGDAIVGQVDGVVGPLVDHVEIDAGAEVAVAAALGDALNAIVVQGDRAARDAIERLKRGDDKALLLVIGANGGGAQGVLAPPGTRPLSACVRGTRPGLDRVLANLLAPFVLVEGGWAAALDVALADPGVVAVTPEGDRFGGHSIWRAGPPGSSVVTPAALAEADSRGRPRPKPRATNPIARVELARHELAAARRAELLATERERADRAELEQLTARAAQLRRDVEVRSASLEERQATLRARLAALEAERRRAARNADGVARRASPRRPPRPSRRRAGAPRSTGSACRPRACVRTTRYAARPSRNGAPCSRSGSPKSTRGSPLAPTKRPRPAPGAATSNGGDTRRARSPTGSRRGRVRSSSSPNACASAGRSSRMRHARPAAGSTVSRTERAGAEKQLGELRERVNRLEIEEAEVRLRLEQAVERIRHDFDCEPDAALAAPAPEVPEGITLSARAHASSNASCD